MTATDLHQRMLHQLDRVKALNTSSPGDPEQSLEPKPHVSQAVDAPAGQPHIPAVNDEQPVTEPQATFSDEDDERSLPRQEVQKQGLIVFAGLERGLECEIKDLTSAGAKLHLGGNVTVPSCFTLTILPENTSRSAQVCWRDEQELGIQFIEDE